MVKINEKDFPIYNMDTITTIVKRIASVYKTLSKYVYFPDNIPDISEFRKSGNIKVENLLQTIKDYIGKDGIDFSGLYTEIDPKLEQQQLDLLTDVLEPFIVYNMDISTTQEYILLVLQVQLKDAEYFSDELSLDDLNHIYEEGKTIRDKITREIALNSKNVLKQIAMFKRLDKAIGIEYTPFESQRIEFSLTFETPNISITELFNYIQLSDRIPFACVDNFYKILKDFVPPQDDGKDSDWSISLPDIIIFRILQRKVYKQPSKISNYITILVNISGEPGHEIATAQMIYNYDKNNISRDELEDSFLQTIKELRVIARVDDGIKGPFYLPHHTIDKYVIADLVLNNPLFSEIMTIDESSKATTSKGSIYIHYNTLDTGILTANITEKISEKNEPYLVGKDILNTFKYGSSYIRVLITSANNIKAVQKFQEIFSKLLKIYDEEYDSIVEIYREFIPDFAYRPELPEIVPVELRLKDIAPEIFVKGYAKMCGHAPKIIEDELVDKAKQEGKIVMRYPESNPTETRISRNYICDFLALTSLNISNCGLDNSCVEILKSMKTLTSLNISGNDIDIEGINDIIASLPLLTRLNTSIKKANLLPFIDTIPQNSVDCADKKKNEKILSLNCPDIDIELLINFPNLLSLNISNRGITPQQTVNILSVCTKLTTLDISGNMIGVEGLKAIRGVNEFIYPGLTKKDNFPCCYIKDNSQKQPSQKTVEPKQQQLITTNKFATRNNFGKLPEDMKKMFDIFNYQESYQFARKGVTDSKGSSLLECVLEGMNDETKFIDKNLDDKDESNAYLYRERVKLSNQRNAASCRQEMYDFTLKDILQAIRDPKVYLDPRLFIHMLELQYNCNIYVFTRKDTTIEIMLPRHLQAYYTNLNTKKCILIYEHYGSDSDAAKQPRCELIVRYKIKTGEDVDYDSTYDSAICKGVRNLFNQLIDSYVLNIHVKETVFPISGLTLVSQCIDSYGKCRMINFTKGVVNGTFLVSPMAPFAIPEVTSWVVTPIDSKVALQIAASLGMIVSKQNVVNSNAKSYSGILGNVEVTIPIVAARPVSGIIQISEEGINYIEVISSKLSDYNKYKKLSRYIVAYMLWLYSSYLYKNSMSMSLESIYNFQTRYIKIDPNFVYGLVGKVFDRNSGIMSNNKLVVKSEETLKRLMYVLRLEHEDKILSYHNRTAIENYYSDVTDFDQYQFQVILEGEQSVEKWIKEHKLNYELYDSVQVDHKYPYFFKNSMIDEEVYLAQNTDTMDKAIEIWSNWQTEITQRVPITFTVYSYRNNSDIEKYTIIKGPIVADTLKIMAYKIKDVAYYTVLLSL